MSDSEDHLSQYNDRKLLSDEKDKKWKLIIFKFIYIYIL